jgi:kumamolisin
MKLSIGVSTLGVAAIALGLSAAPLAAQESALVEYGKLRVKLDRDVPGKGRIAIPESSLPKPGRVRTHTEILIPDHPIDPPGVASSRSVSPAAVTSLAETPASLACVYRLVPQTAGCNPNTVSAVATGGSRVIAIVDAFHNPTVRADLRAFSTHFGLPDPVLQVVYCSATSCAGVTTPPPVDPGWAMEIALDVQAAHAMAPNAKIILVEAFSDLFSDILRAVDRAKQLVANAGGGQVSNSYGAPDDGSDMGYFSSQDGHFLKAGVVFFASTGDHKQGTTVADVEWPSTSPNVVAVGGTTILRNSMTNAFSSEKAWLDGGGGVSAYAARPSYQNVIPLGGAKRAVPDIAGDADPASGMAVRCAPSTCGQPISAGSWLVVGGTSLASPLLAGIANSAGHFRASSKLELQAIYNGLGSNRYNDITAGRCGNGANGAFVNAVAGWDRCTGVGTPRGPNGL